MSNVKVQFAKIIEQRNMYIRSLVLISLICICANAFGQYMLSFQRPSKIISFAGLIFNGYLAYKLINEFRCPKCNKLLISESGRNIKICNNCNAKLK